MANSANGHILYLLVSTVNSEYFSFLYTLWPIRLMAILLYLLASTGQQWILFFFVYFGIIKFFLIKFWSFVSTSYYLLSHFNAIIFCTLSLYHYHSLYSITLPPSSNVYSITLPSSYSLFYHFTATVFSTLSL